MPPQDTKWHKVSLSGKDTKWHKVCQLVSLVMFVTMATIKIVEKPFFMLIKKVVKEIVVLENYLRQLWFPWQKKYRMSLNY